ncbi:hypothetical protein CEXT_83681 [Caerostris extrusa]|uniref:Uncharacterized protein n=1 Tax=Caerostris extrusa TaxID=172846 RepID=A0AAV4RF10_CAEEX|nr:hypothetical protein CEXT_83681 [Caerostris extrusa]
MRTMLLQHYATKATHFVLRTDSWKSRKINGGADGGLTKAREIGHLHLEHLSTKREIDPRQSLASFSDLAT